MASAILFTAVGLAAAGYGLSGDSALRVLAAVAGWIIFLAGVVKIMVPGFFG